MVAELLDFLVTHCRAFGAVRTAHFLIVFCAGSHGELGQVRLLTLTAAVLAGRRGVFRHARAEPRVVDVLALGVDQREQRRGLCRRGRVVVGVGRGDVDVVGRVVCDDVVV